MNNFLVFKYFTWKYSPYFEIRGSYHPGVEKYRTMGPLVPENFLSSQKIFARKKKR
jgi:hypothetical protein